MPDATAKPCLTDFCNSIACPKVCPKLSIRLIPASLSSTVTTEALKLTDLATSMVRILKSLSKISSDRFSIISNNSGSPIIAVLIISAKPDRYSFSGKVVSIEVSQITNSGCLIMPNIFFVAPRFTPFFPPVLAST